MIGNKLSPILEEIHDTLWEFEADHPGVPMKHTLKSLKAACKIFSCVLLDFMWLKIQKDGIGQLYAEQMAEEVGNKIREMVIKYTGVDPKDLYK